MRPIDAGIECVQPRLQMTATINRSPIASSSLASVGYAEDEGVLEAEFRSGDIYRFFLVPVTIWDELVRADSKGAFFNREIRDRYPFVAMPPQVSGELTPDLERSLALLKSRNEPPESDPK